MLIHSKLPNIGTTIFTVMTALAETHKAINLAQGFPDFPSSPHLIELVNQYMRKGFNQYAPMPGLPLLRERIAEKISALYGIAVDPGTEITITAGGTQALFTAITAFIHPGDEVIILEPAYDSYRPAIELAGGTVKAYELSPPHYRPDWEQLKKLISMHTKMIIINTPHNPTGTILQHDDMLRLEQLLQGTDILVLSDEVYEHLVFDAQAHHSILRYPGLRERGIAVFSFGKTFHNTGWKIGYCVAPQPLNVEFRKVHQFNVFSVNTPIQYALAEFLSDPFEYLGLGTFYHHKRDFFLDVLENSPFRPLPCAGTYFLLCDYSAISDEPDADFARRLTAEYGVAAVPVSAFYNSQRDERLLRFCFAKQEQTLERAGERLSRIPLHA
jgi:methionine aminotransferase